MIAFCIRSLNYRTNICRKLGNDFRAFAMSENQKIKAVLIDLSGTLHIENTAIPGAVEALKRLRSRDIAIRFVTNTTKESKRSLVAKLISLGFEIQSDEVFTSLTAARNLIEAKGVRPLLILEDSALEDFNGIEVNDPNSVVVGLAPSKFNYQSLQDAFRLILSGASLIAIHKARYYKRSDGLSLGPGPFVVGLEYATGVQAEVAGKPEKTFFLESLRGLNCSPQSAVMIGDDVRDDIGGAQNIGMKGILVRTGKYRDQDENKITPGPNVVCDDFPGAVDHIFKNWL